MFVMKRPKKKKLYRRCPKQNNIKESKEGLRLTCPAEKGGRR